MVFLLNFDPFSYKYPSRRTLVYGSRGMVCATQPLAAQAGLDMIKKGGSAVDAITMIKKRGAKHIKFIGLIGAPEGVEAMRAAHPDVQIYLGALDDHLDQKGYIVPGLGDAGDRIYGTK